MGYSEKELSEHRLQKAKEDFEAAKELFANDKFSQSINRSYYAIFHATRALLTFDRFDSKKHSGVIHFFHHNYIATNKIEPPIRENVINRIQYTSSGRLS